MNFSLQVLCGTIDITSPKFVLRVKLSGDGAKMSRLTNFVVISFSLLNSQKFVMSSKGMVIQVKHLLTLALVYTLQFDLYSFFI